MTDTVGATETSSESFEGSTNGSTRESTLSASSNGQTKNHKARATQRGDRSNTSRGLHLERLYTTAGVHPYDEVSWQRRDVVMTNWRDGSINFEQRGVEFPDFWSINATNIVTSKYFRGAVGTPVRESSLRQIIDRVVGSYTAAGVENGYFATAEDGCAIDCLLNGDGVLCLAVTGRPKVTNVQHHPGFRCSWPGLAEHRRMTHHHQAQGGNDNQTG